MSGLLIIGIGHRHIMILEIGELPGGSMKQYLLEKDERNICFCSTEGMHREEIETTEIRQDHEETGHLGILQNFTNAVLYGEKLIAPGVDGINGLMLSNAAYLSTWKNDWVNLPIDGREFQEYLIKKQNDEKIIQRKVVREKMSEEYSQRWKVRW